MSDQNGNMKTIELHENGLDIQFHNQLIADFISLYKHCAKLRFYAILKPIFRIYVLILTYFS